MYHLETIGSHHGRDHMVVGLPTTYNRCLSPLKLWVRIPLRWCVLNTTLCDKICQWLVTGLWFSPWTLIYSTNKTDSHDTTEILLKVALNTRTLTLETIKIKTDHFQQFKSHNSRMAKIKIIKFKLDLHFVNHNIVLKFTTFKAAVFHLSSGS